MISDENKRSVRKKIEKCRVKVGVKEEKEHLGTFVLDTEHWSNSLYTMSKSCCTKKLPSVAPLVIFSCSLA